MPKNSGVNKGTGAGGGPQSIGKGGSQAKAMPTKGARGNAAVTSAKAVSNPKTGGSLSKGSVGGASQVRMPRGKR